MKEVGGAHLISWTIFCEAPEVTAGWQESDNTLSGNSN